MNGLDNCVADILIEKFFISQDKDALDALISSSQDQSLIEIYKNKLRALKLKESNLIDLITITPSDAAINKLETLIKEKLLLEQKIADQEVAHSHFLSKSD